MSDDESVQSHSTIIATAGIALGSVTVTATADARRNFSFPHLTAADHFASELARHEAEHVGAGWGSHVEFCGWYASAAIILSFSAIEASLDEAMDDLGLPDELSRVLERASTLDQAQALLAHCGRQPFDPGWATLRNADLLRALRNGLVHPKSEWDSAGTRNKQLSRKIVGAGLPLSPFMQDPSLAFPHGCMSAGVATWGAQTARLITRYRDERQTQAFETCLFGSALAFRTATDHAVTFSADSYYVDGRHRYAGHNRFPKHLNPDQIGAFDSNEEERCALTIELNPKVRRWVRNLVRRPESFKLATSKGWFYPDFVAELTDGRYLAVEYKGGHLAGNDDTAEKELVGKKWAEASGGACLFVMAKDQDYGAVERALS